MVGEKEHPEDYENKFYWSFYELNNGLIVSVNYHQTIKNRKVVDDDLDMTYSHSELKNGEIIHYDFTQDFFDWFNALPPVKDLKKILSPTEKERECVKNFFYDKVFDSVSISTEVIEV